MSLVNVLIVRDDCLYFVRVHRRELQGVLENPQKAVRLCRPVFLDAGYVVLDLNRKALINSQGATSARTAGFEVWEV